MVVEVRAGQKPRKPEEIEVVEYPEGLVLIDPVTGRLARLDALSSLVWLLSDGERTGADIVRELSQAKKDITEAQVSRVIGELVDSAFLALEDHSVAREMGGTPGR